MSSAILQYDAKMDSKKRITLRNALYEYYHAIQYEDGRILLEPRELVAPVQLSENTLYMMDEAIKSYKAGKVSEPIDLSDFEE